jgi:hypothetical protein
MSKLASISPVLAVPNFSDEELVLILNAARNGVNGPGITEAETENDGLNLKRTLIEAKVLVDRWGRVTLTFILHPNLEGRCKIQATTAYFSGHLFLWGAAILFDGRLPNLTLLAIDNSAIFPTDEFDPAFNEEAVSFAQCVMNEQWRMYEALK